MSGSDGAPDVQVVDVPEHERFEARLDGKLVGFAAYEVKPGRIVFTHTEVPDEYEGRGFASALVGEALRQVAARGLTVVPRCPFVAAYLRRHPDGTAATAGH